MGPSAQRGVDIALGAATVALATAGAARKRLGPVASPLGRLVLHPPLLPASTHPARWVERAAAIGAAQRSLVVVELSRLLDALVPALLDAVLRRAGVTELVLRHVDLDAVVAGVDLEGAVARVDLDRVVERVDLDRAVARVDLDRAVARVDVEAVVARVDVDDVARRLDLDAVVDRLDLTATVLDKVDLTAVLDAVLDRLDLTALVLERVDLAAVAEAVLDRIDLPAIAGEVVEAIDLPEIIRESSGSMASDTVRTARMQGIAADEAVGRAVDRLLLRRTPRR